MNLDIARAYAGLFDPFRLRIARHLAGLRKSDLAKRVDLTPAALTQYENGHAKPSAAVLIKLSLALAQPIEFFAKDGRRAEVDGGRSYFRSLRSTRQIDRDKAEARAFLTSEIVGELRNHVHLPALALPDNLHVSEDASRETIEQRAEALREYWKLDNGPIPNVVRLLESRGIIVTRCSDDCREVDAFSRWFLHGPIVVLNASKPLDRARYDGAHELGHLILHTEAEAGNSRLEEQANMFAAAFLMPRKAITEQLPSRLDWDAFRALKNQWGVSVQALLRRSLSLGRMSDATYRRAMIILSKLNQRMNETHFPLSGFERPVLLQKAIEVLGEKNYTIEKLAKDTKLAEGFVRETIYGEVNRLPEVDLVLK